MKRLFLLWFLILPNSALALTAKQVVDSSLRHYPQVIESVLNVEEKKGSLKEAKGAFDTRITGGVNSKTEGYYDGDIYTGQVVKPFPFLNSRVYGGYKNSFGEFPVYEGFYDTSEHGQGFAGLAVSLLRNSMIDINRYQVRIRDEDRIQSEIDLDRVKIAVQTLALQAYYTWLVKGHELKVFKGILGLAKQRVRQIERRIKVGDMARIFQAENDQYIRRRQARVLQGELEFQRASYRLALFYRDATGKMIEVSESDLPDLNSDQLGRIREKEQVLRVATERNLDLKTLGSRERQAEAEIDMGFNELLPKVDLSFEYGQNRGLGFTNRTREDEGKLMLNIEVPLEFNRGLGRRQAGRSQLEQVKTRKGFVEDKLQTEVDTLLTQLNKFAEIYDVTKDEVDLAKTLADAEMRKFTQGASDLILVNIREENLAEAQITNLQTLLSYYLTSADIRRIQVDFL